MDDIRLLNTSTLEMEKFFITRDRPRYVILSHRWEKSEADLHLFEKEKYNLTHECPPGVVKIREFCARANNAGYDWCWADTCCIDKTNSAELSEAINSMWEWYREAQACYVYLTDVDNRSIPDAPQTSPIATGLASNLRRSAWFSRGWTLQELLAPKVVIFFDFRWNFLGFRDEELFGQVLSEITHIDRKCFGDIAKLNQALIAEKMSWMSTRRTSRLEDLAYCMLGIFDVNMPLIYGEGLKAFTRLQLEIVAKYDDESIFLWQSEDHKGAHGLLASHPSSFAWLHESQVKLARKTWLQRQPYRMTNRGLELEIFDSISVKSMAKVEIPLNIVVIGKGCAILSLECLKDSTYVRIDCGKLGYDERLLDKTHFATESRQHFIIYVRQYNVERFLS